MVVKITYQGVRVNLLPRVYEPSEDTFLLARTALEEVRWGERVLEMGCGCGLVSAVLAARKNAKVVGVDINPDAVRCARLNGVQAVRGDLFTGIRGSFDLVVFNPPYLPSRIDGVSREEDSIEKIEETADERWLDLALDGGLTGREVIERFLWQLPSHLNPGGRLLLLVSTITGVEEVKSLLHSQGFRVWWAGSERLWFEELVVLGASL